MKLDYKFTVNDVVKQNKTSEEDINKVKEWLLTNNEKDVPSVIQDQLIVLFLLSCNNDIELTKKTIKSYYKCRKQNPDMFDDRVLDREDLQKAFNTMKMIYLPGRTDDNKAIIYFRMKDTNYKNWQLLPIMKASYMLMDIENEEIPTPPDGIMYLIDMEGFGMMHLTKMSPDQIKKYFEYLAEGLPMKFTSMHFLNANYFLEKVLDILKLFLLPHVMEKLHMHPKGFPAKELFEIIPKSCLPRELEGDLESEDILFERTMELLRKRENFWKVEEALRKNI